MNFGRVRLTFLGHDQFAKTKFVWFGDRAKRHRNERHSSGGISMAFEENGRQVKAQFASHRPPIGGWTTVIERSQRTITGREQQEEIGSWWRGAQVEQKKKSKKKRAHFLRSAGA